MLMRRLLVVLACLVPACFGQMTADQKVADFMQLAGLYAKYYAPYEWKRDVMGFDLMKVQPWLDKVKASKDDVEFMDICVKYVAALQDSHDEFTLPSDFYAYIDITADIYDGKVLVDWIDRSMLPLRKFPFQIGDEVTQVDGKPIEDVITELSPYAANGMGNPSSRRRLAVDAFTFRQQYFMPRAHEVGDTMVLTIKSQDGSEANYEVPVHKSGTPYTHVGHVDTPAVKPAEIAGVLAKARQSRMQALSLRGNASRAQAWESGADNPWGVWQGEPPEAVEESVPDYAKPLKEFQTMKAVDAPLAFGGFGSVYPAFNPPSGFKLRLGAGRNDYFLSGTYLVGTARVGFIRIPTMSPSSTATALAQFANEIAYFNANTDGLVIDVMANGGGSLCYIESLMSYLAQKPFRGAAYEIRATQYWAYYFSSTLTSAKSSGAPQWMIDLYAAYLSQLQEALQGNRGRTGSIPICTPNFENISPATSSNGTLLSYSKPILLLTDEFSLSAAESFAMFLQDEGRATIFGVRTDGGGGNPGSYNATTYSEGSTRVTRTFVTRKQAVVTPDFPASNYLENTGVYPDIVENYMTYDNLMTGGRTFVTNFSAAIANLIAQSQK